MEVYRYKVPPKSGPRYFDNMERYGEHGACAICGKRVKGSEDELPWGWILDTENGFIWAPADYQGSPEEMDALGVTSDYGCWPIGPDCHKRHVIKE